ncbi:hypothetical protein [Algoriphagus boritolerans]|uniref:hypothetical protein n=1 Tax=Algoriphagus boritolerans TaxID=308111 RepID=UPI002FCE4262
MASAKMDEPTGEYQKKPSLSFGKKEKNRDIIQLKSDNQVIFSTEITHGGISFPVSTSFLPINLCQTWNKVKYNTKPTGFGWGKLAKVQNLDLNPDFFPDIQKNQTFTGDQDKSFSNQFPRTDF